MNATIVNRWKEYVQELFTDVNRESPAGRIKDPSKGNDILMSEVTKAIDEIASRKASGQDEIFAEYLKNLDPKTMEKLHEILNDMYNQE